MEQNTKATITASVKDAIERLDAACRSVSLDKSNICDYEPTPQVAAPKVEKPTGFTLTFPNDISNEAVETIIRIVDLIAKRPKTLKHLKRMVDEDEEEEIRAKYAKLKAHAETQTEEKARNRALEDLFDYIMSNNLLITNDTVMRETRDQLRTLILDENKFRFTEYYEKFRETFKAMDEDF